MVPRGSRRGHLEIRSSLWASAQRDGGDSSKLPTSHTCFNTLLLPEYATLERMRERLRLAIMNAEGFGLE